MADEEKKEPQAEKPAETQPAAEKAAEKPAAEAAKPAEAADPAPAQAGPNAPPKVVRPTGKRGHRSVPFAKVFIQCTFNNTIVSITDDRGNVLAWATAGNSGFKGTKKGTPFAAQMTAQKVGKRAAELGVKQVAVFVKGPGPGRETAIRALQSAGLQVVSLKDVSPIPHNGCRAPKPRRV